jgi:UDP-2,3-diacylglucosamine hydrolase
VSEAFSRYDVTQLIHGHTHRPAIHELTVDGRKARRIVLGDWYQHGSVLRVSANDLELSELALKA